MWCRITVNTGVSPACAIKQRPLRCLGPGSQLSALRVDSNQIRMNSWWHFSLYPRAQIIMPLRLPALGAFEISVSGQAQLGAG